MWSSTFVDEVGYLSYDAHASDLLFQVISRRYEQNSIVITTNAPFKHWDTVFPNATCAVALIDRLTHHAEIITIEGESYRKREAELAQKRNRNRSADPRQDFVGPDLRVMESAALW
jgi:DNA replication protein DnaC